MFHGQLDGNSSRLGTEAHQVVERKVGDLVARDFGDTRLKRTKPFGSSVLERVVIRSTLTWSLERNPL